MINLKKNVIQNFSVKIKLYSRIMFYHNKYFVITIYETQAAGCFLFIPGQLEKYSVFDKSKQSLSIKDINYYEYQ